MRPYVQPPPPSILESNRWHSEKMQAPFAESGFRPSAAELFTTVNFSMAEERSAKPFPLQLILSALLPLGLKVCPAGEEHTSWREVTLGLPLGSLSWRPAMGEISAALREASRPDIVFYKLQGGFSHAAMRT